MMRAGSSTPGHNTLETPPPVVRYLREHGDREQYFRQYGTYELLLPRKTANGIAWEEPVPHRLPPPPSPQAIPAQKRYEPGRWERAGTGGGPPF